MARRLKLIAAFFAVYLFGIATPYLVQRPIAALGHSIGGREEFREGLPLMASLMQWYKKIDQDRQQHPILVPEPREAEDRIRLQAKK
jgi:hypothetical protein